MTTEERIKKVVSEQLGVKVDEISATTKPVDDLGADSLDLIELVMAVEEEFEIDIHDEDAEKVSTIQEAVELVDRILA